MSNVPLIRLERICKRYIDDKSPVEALMDISMTVEKGDSVAIMGKSGSGKTTLLQILAGLIRPTSGKYYFHGEEIDTCRDRQLFEFRRTHIGFVPQEHALLENETVCNNVSLPLRLRHWKASAIAEAVEMALSEIDLSSKASCIVQHLSGGQKQRVALARALCTRPEVILADEPTAALDPESQREILDCLWDLRAAGTTILVVTHDPVVAARCRHVLVLDNGILLSKS